MVTSDAALLQQIDKLSAPELRRLLAEHLTSRKLGLTWERDAIAHDRALNADVVLPRLDTAGMRAMRVAMRRSSPALSVRSVAPAGPREHTPAHTVVGVAVVNSKVVSS